MTPNTSKSQTKSSSPKPPPKPDGKAFHFALAVVLFLFSLVPVGLLLWKAEMLTALGLTEKFHYITLTPLGLLVAVCLFGMLHSVGKYRGKQLGGVLEIGGPAAGFFLFMVLGFVLPKPAANFSVTVFVHGSAGLHDLPLKNGHVFLDLGGDRRREELNEKGQAIFPEIPASFRGKEVTLGLDATGFELAAPDPKKRLNGESLYVTAQRKPGKITGRVQDQSGQPIANAKIDGPDISAQTNQAGRFELTIPGEQMRPEFPIKITAPGFEPWSGHAVPDANELTAQMTGKP